MTSETIIIQSVTYDKVVRDFHRYIFNVEVYLELFRFHQQRSDMNSFGVA